MKTTSRRRHSAFRTPRPSRTSRRRRLLLETLENRSLLAGDLSISDAMAVEGSSTMKFIDAFVTPQSGGLWGARGIDYGPDGNLYLSADNGACFACGEPTLGYVNRYDAATGAFIDVFASDPTMNGAKDVEFGPDGNLYVPNENGNNVYRFNGTTGDFIDVFVATGSGGLRTPRSLLFGPDGNADGNLDVYITSAGTNSVHRFDGVTGAFIDAFVPSESGGLFSPTALVFGPDGNLYVASGAHADFYNSILRYDGATGAFMNAFVPAGGGGLTLAPTAGVIFGPDVNNDSTPDMYVSNGEVDEVLIYNGSNGSFLQKFITPGLGGLNDPKGYVSATGTLTFAPGQMTQTILVQTLDDTAVESTETFTVNLSNPVGGVIVDGQGVGTIVDDEPEPTKFYVVDDAAANKTFEYGASGAASENYTVNSGNAAPRGAASTVAGDKVWVVDNNRTVYVYDAGGGLLGSWTAGTLAGNAQPQGIATNGVDVWIVDAKSDKVFKYAGAATRLSGSQNAASSFNLYGSNGAPTDIVTDGASLWVTNDSGNDKVFKYTVAGSLLGSWTITGAGSSPTGITLEPSSPSHLWIVDSGSDRVYQFDSAISRTSGSQSPSTSFALAAGNTNPQGIADPPAPGGSSSTAAGSDAALLSLLGDLESLTPARKRRR